MSDDEKRETGYGGLSSPRKPKPVRAPGTGVNFTDTKVNYSDILTDGAGIPLLPKRDRKAHFPSVQPLVPEEVIQTRQRESIMINGAEVWRSVGEQHLTQWYEIEVKKAGNNFHECVSLLVQMYQKVNDDFFPQWATKFLESHHLQPRHDAS